MHTTSEVITNVLQQHEKIWGNALSDAMNTCNEEIKSSDTSSNEAINPAIQECLLKFLRHIKSFVAKSKAIDLVACPNDFRLAYNDHIQGLEKKINDGLMLPCTTYDSDYLMAALDAMYAIVQFNAKSWASVAQSAVRNGEQWNGTSSHKEHIDPKNAPCVVTPSPAASFVRLWIDHGIIQNGHAGMLIHIHLTISYMKGQEGFVSVFFEYADGSRMVTTNTSYTTPDKQLAKGVAVNSPWDSTEWKDLQIFMPTDVLYASVDATCVNSCRFFAMAFRKDQAGKWTGIDRSFYEAFTLNPRTVSQNVPPPPPSTRRNPMFINLNR